MDSDLNRNTVCKVFIFYAVTKNMLFSTVRVVNVKQKFLKPSELARSGNDENANESSDCFIVYELQPLS